MRVKMTLRGVFSSGVSSRRHAVADEESTSVFHAGCTCEVDMKALCVSVSNEQYQLVASLSLIIPPPHPLPCTPPQDPDSEE